MCEIFVQHWWLFTNVRQIWKLIVRCNFKVTLVLLEYLSVEYLWRCTEGWLIGRCESDAMKPHYAYIPSAMQPPLSYTIAFQRLPSRFIGRSAVRFNTLVVYIHQIILPVGPIFNDFFPFSLPNKHFDWRTHKSFYCKFTYQDVCTHQYNITWNYSYVSNRCFMWSATQLLRR